MADKFQIDRLDKKILSFLTENARKPFLEIARECGISGAAVHQRVLKLENAGIVMGSKFIINPVTAGYNTCAFVGVFLEKASLYKEVIKKLNTIPEVVECHYTTGNYSIFLKVYCRDNQHLLHVLYSCIQEIPGVTRTETFISLDKAIERQVEITLNEKKAE